MKAYGEVKSIGPTILNVGTRWKSLVYFIPRGIYLWRQRRRYPLIRSSAGTRTGLDTSEKRKISAPSENMAFRLTDKDLVFMSFTMRLQSATFIYILALRTEFCIDQVIVVVML
jgi:hypothetical protein